MEPTFSPGEHWVPHIWLPLQFSGFEPRLVWCCPLCHFHYSSCLYPLEGDVGEMILFEGDVGPGDPQRERLWVPGHLGWKGRQHCPDLTVVSLRSMPSLVIPHRVLPAPGQVLPTVGIAQYQSACLLPRRPPGVPGKAEYTARFWAKPKHIRMRTLSFWRGEPASELKCVERGGLAISVPTPHSFPGSPMQASMWETTSHPYDSDPNLQSLQVLQLHFMTSLWLGSAVCAS